MNWAVVRLVIGVVYFLVGLSLITMNTEVVAANSSAVGVVFKIADVGALVAILAGIFLVVSNARKLKGARP